MSVSVPNIRSGPIAFISSFYQEKEGYLDRWSSPLWQLRQDLAALNTDSVFRSLVPEAINRPLTWVAEKSEPGLINEPDPLAVVDRLIDVLKGSELYVCILADRRRGEGDHGSPVLVDHRPSAVSYLEVELYAAALYGKPVHLFLLEGFSPGPRLQSLLSILRFALPDWRDHTPQKTSDIFSAVKQLLQFHLSRASAPNTCLRQRLVRGFFHSRAGQPSTLNPGCLFLDAATEVRPLPDVQRVEALINEYRREPHFQKRLNRIWIAVRELMPASYQPKEVQADSRLKVYLPLWDSVLADWSAAASWHGWHGHLYAGTVAPLNSRSLIRAQGYISSSAPDYTGHAMPAGALASAYYSIAGLLGFGRLYWHCLQFARQNINEAIASQGLTDNLLALRGSLRLRMGDPFGAVDDFKEMRRLREAAGASPQKIAEALMHEGYGYSFLPFSSKARALLQESIQLYQAYPNDPNLPRAMRKLAFADQMSLRFKDARKWRIEANRVAIAIGADDQANR